MIATEWPRDSSVWARVEPTRPHPLITMCTYGLLTSSPPSLPCPCAVGCAGRSGAGCATHVRLTVVASPTSLLKRLLIGRPFRSDRMHHTLLPKRIALPVFASDALSSVAYAPDEILLTLSVGGAAF